MRRTLAFAIAALLLGACASGVEPSAPPSTGQPSQATTPAPSAGTPPPEASILPSRPASTPLPTTPADLATRAVASADGVRLTIEAAAVPLVAGVPTEVTVRLENRGSGAISWIDGGCGMPGTRYVQLMDESWIGGATHTGIAAEFKAFALEPFGHAGFSPLSLGLQPDEAAKGLACVELGASVGGRVAAGGIGIGRTLAAGESLGATLHWTGVSDRPIPAGMADLVFQFKFSRGGFEGDQTRVEARLASWIVSDAVFDFIPPGPAIDIALADDEFAVWLRSAPSSTWINTHHTLDVDASTWDIGLFRQSEVGFYGGVTFNSSTGEILDHRFE